MLQLDDFFDFTGLEALNAYPYSHRGAVYDGADVLKIRQEPPGVYAGYFLADSAFFLGQTTSLYGSSGNRFFAAYRADF